MIPSHLDISPDRPRVTTSQSDIPSGWLGTTHRRLAIARGRQPVVLGHHLPLFCANVDTPHPGIALVRTLVPSLGLSSAGPVRLGCSVLV